ncbi:uncharacterized protein EMH_0077000 [Eimeria mitis]|uniref:Trypsin n=1 Tax=Eimeria mitis TaxID=44415 RepID=U6K8Y8_9EIME|nr:uncharacterized protein EMH_0077000 [Eimeria mitis]CDJ32682.1 hypothetical protein EMH_0077000 [Eimeria mitis]
MKIATFSSFLFLCADSGSGYRLESNAGASSSAPLPVLDTGEDGMQWSLPDGRTAEAPGENDKPSNAPLPQTSFAEDGGTAVVSGAADSGAGTADVQQTPSKQPKQIRKGAAHVPEMQELASVVKIFVDTVAADFVSPWQMMAPKEHSGSGFVVEGQMIMTNAHVVANQTRVLVRRHGNPKRFLAKVIAVCHECDLALVTVDDEDFWRGLKPLPFGGVPHLRETVVVLGYPTGGDQLSITEGVVSRVGVSTYAHSYLGLLTVQIDAPINPGNSGGPAISEGKVVGVAFQGFSEMQNVGYIVPFPVIRHFLNDIALHKRHTGIVSMGIKAQTMENEGEDSASYFTI